MDERALELLRQQGRTPGDVLGVGMEGTVIDLSGDEVAKVWHGRSRADLGSILDFGAALGNAAIPFPTSGAIGLLEGDDVLITIERKLGGVPLRLDHVPNPPTASDAEARLMGDALEGLSRAHDPRLATLPILPGEPPFAPGVAFTASLAGLVERRFRTRPQLLRREVRDIDALVTALVAALRELPQRRAPALVHGDLIPANVMVADREVSGILDFGFMTTLGDPQFDAAITASVFDMYGANARASEDLLSTEFIARFGHEPRAYALYRAAYAVATNAYFALDGADGHFEWCATMLQRADVRNAIAR